MTFSDWVDGYYFYTDPREASKEAWNAALNEAIGVLNQSNDDNSLLGLIVELEGMKS